MVAMIAIRVPRNADFTSSLTLVDKLTGDPIDITGWTFALHIKSSASPDSPTLSIANFSNIDGENGSMDMIIRGESLSGVPGEQEVVRLAYDLLGRDEEGVTALTIEGEILLTPGVSSI